MLRNDEDQGLYAPRDYMIVNDDYSPLVDLHQEHVVPWSTIYHFCGVLLFLAAILFVIGSVESILFPLLLGDFDFSYVFSKENAYAFSLFVGFELLITAAFGIRSVLLGGRMTSAYHMFLLLVFGVALLLVHLGLHIYVLAMRFNTGAQFSCHIAALVLGLLAFVTSILLLVKTAFSLGAYSWKRLKSGKQPRNS